MEQLPKIVRERLQASQAGAHPDPDLLTAFSEESLSPRERTQVLEHLSRCGECREVISLATPEPALSSKPHPVPSVSGWLRWPVLRWGALAACVVVVSAVGLLYRGRLSRSEVQPMTDERNLAAADLPKQAEAEKPSTAAPQTKERPETRTDALRAAAPPKKALAASHSASEAERFDKVAKLAPAAPPSAGASGNRFAFDVESNKVAAVPGPSENLQAAPPSAYQDTLTGGGPIPVAKPAPTDKVAREERGNTDQVVAEVVAVTPEIPAREVKSAKRKAEEGGAQKLPKQVDSDVTETQ